MKGEKFVMFFNTGKKFIKIVSEKVVVKGV